MFSGLLLGQTKKLTYWFGNDSIKGIEKVVEVLESDSAVMQGEYLHFFQNGSIRIQGDFFNNKPTGKWLYYFESGKIKHEVSYYTDSTSYWVYYFENSKKKQEGKVLNHKRDSLWTYYYEEGAVLKQGEFHEGLQDKVWNYYYEDGASKAVATYDKGSGTYTEYFYNGELKMSGPVIKNLSNGIWSYYYETGNLKAKGYEADGVKNGRWEYYYVNDSLASRGNYVNGAKQGQWQFYFDNGVPSSEGLMSENLRDGYWKLYNENGSFKADANLLNGTGVYKEYHDNNKLKIEGYLKEDKNHGHWDYFYDDGTLEGMADFIDGEGNYVGYYQSGELKMKGVIKDGKQIGTWELFDKEGAVIGYYKLIPSGASDEGLAKLEMPSTDMNPPPALPSDTVVSHRMPHYKVRNRSRYKPFKPRSGESKGFIIGGNPVAMVANQIPISLEYFIQERMGYELRYTFRRTPFLTPDRNLGDSTLYMRGYSLDFKQKFYSKFKEDKGMLYFGHEFRITQEQFFVKSDNSMVLNKMDQNKYEYAWTVGDRVLRNIRKGGFTFDIYAGLGVAYVTQKWDVTSGVESKYLSISRDKFQLNPKIGFSLGYLF